MVFRFVLPMVAAAFFGYAVVHIPRTGESQFQQPLQDPPTSPYAQSIAGYGVVEAESENIEIGSPVAGIVVEVTASECQPVQKGAPLFRLDDRALQAELAVRTASLKAAEAELERLRNQPRTEQLPVYEAAVEEARATWLGKQDDLERARQLRTRQALSEQELRQHESAFNAAKAGLEKAQAELDLIKAGAWSEDVAVAEAAVARAAAQVQQTKVDLERLTVRATVSGQVLQVNVRPGEYVSTPPLRPAFVLGNTSELHVRMDIDEQDIPRYREGAPAVAIVRGDSQRRLPLSFVCVKPYVVPKTTLSGENTERFDTRVLQVVYSVGQNEGDAPLYVGQQVEVFLAAGAAVNEENIGSPLPDGTGQSLSTASR